MATHTIIASNSLTNEIIAEIPATDAHHSRTLNDSGSLEASIPMDDPNVRALALVANEVVEPAAIAIYCLRDQTYEWGGLLWAHEYDSTSAALKITAYEFGSYLACRYIAQKLAYSGDVSTLAGGWVSQVFDDNGPPVLTSLTATGLAMSGAFNAWEQHNVLDLVKAYNAMTGGYDWSFDVGTDGNGNPCAEFVTSYPRRGVSYTNSGIVWDYPGPVMSWQLAKTADPSYFDTDLLVTGAGAGATQLLGEGTITAPGYVKIQQVISNPNLNTQAAVDAFAAGTAAARSKAPLVTIAATLTGDAFYDAGVSTGDEVTLNIVDPYLPSGYIFHGRIIAFDTIFQTASAPEQVKVTFGSPLSA